VVTFLFNDTYLSFLQPLLLTLCLPLASPYAMTDYDSPSRIRYWVHNKLNPLNKLGFFFK